APPHILPATDIGFSFPARLWIMFRISGCRFHPDLSSWPQVLYNASVAIFRTRRSLGRDSDSWCASGRAGWFALICFTCCGSSIHPSQHHLLFESLSSGLVLL